VLRDLKVSFQKNTVLNIPSLSVPSQKLVAVVGPNGGGKTTFLRALLARDVRYAGSVSCPCSWVYMAQNASERKDFPITVKEYVAAGLYKLSGPFSQFSEDDCAKIVQGLEQVCLTGYQDRLLHQLSGGEWQRVQLARFLLLESGGYLLDEPFSAMDRRMVHLLQERLQNLREKGKTIFVVTHDLVSVREFFDYAILLRGDVVAHGKPSEVLVHQNIEKAYG